MGNSWTWDHLRMVTILGGLQFEGEELLGEFGDWVFVLGGFLRLAGVVEGSAAGEAIALLGRCGDTAEHHLS